MQRVPVLGLLVPFSTAEWIVLAFLQEANIAENKREQYQQTAAKGVFSRNDVQSKQLDPLGSISASCRTVCGRCRCNCHSMHGSKDGQDGRLGYGSCGYQRGILVSSKEAGAGVSDDDYPTQTIGPSGDLPT